ncbi:outer membrane protein assembly factor BamA [Zwartia sp.]|uniref:outer membrane protein assembly factor BamA n=1 Tax=Zwartia sp. TaxID=2978004 RepID=UPI0027251A68|nr:outer membrane protein assembly factor BamA [Zwartia sp.]MDO9024364.1 outer membrane protein assembly factor BamA [Zwartia sp.]
MFDKCLRVVTFALCQVILAVSLLAPHNAHAFDPFVVSDIRVEGMQRTEPGSIFAQLPFKVGQRFTEELATESIRKLYATGLYADVRIQTANRVVVVAVQERPTIAAITFTGMREFEPDTIIGSLKQVGFAQGRVFDQSMLEQAQFELRQAYLNKGKYAVEVSPTVTPLPRNRVGINFDLFEGGVSRIREINIVGNTAFSESRLRDLFSLTTPGWLTWYTDSDKYSREKLERDVETLKSFYLDRGYLEFKVEPPQVTISGDRKDIFITLTISEGKPYTVSEVKLAGDLLGLEAEISQLVQLKAGDIFSGAKTNGTAKGIADFLGGLGYAFANVNPNPILDREKQTAEVTFYIDPSRRVYVRRVQVAGNHRSKDEVVRREVRQSEAAWYDSGKIKLSRDRLDRLGYFKEVKVGTEPVPGSPDQVDLNIVVDEKPTGMVSLGVGYGQVDGVILSAGISEENVFGSGTNLTLNLNTGASNRSAVLAHTDPYFTKDGVSRTSSIYYRTITPYSNNPGNYKVTTGGLGLNFGVPITEFNRIFLGASLERNSIGLYDNSPLAYREYVRDYGETTTAVILNTGWSNDTRDSALTPTKGSFTRLKLDLGTGSLDYYLFGAQHQSYFPIGRDYTIAFNGLFDFGNSYKTDLPYPIIKNVYAGGIGSVRGYSQNSLGPTDPLTGTYLGGSKRVVGNVQFYLPFPGTQQDRTLRWFAFADGGQVFGTDGFGNDTSIDFGQLRYSAGIGLSWVSPLGPLQLSFAKPLNAKPGDNTQIFQFQIGTGF